jgi:cytochrome c biogenesis protein CcmG/thiol:disulfide interchange protein DsbE
MLPLLMLFSMCAKAENGTSAAARAESAPAFELTDLEGNSLKLEDYEGQVVLINFWATWCGPCRIEIPDFIEAYDEFHEKGLEILGVSLDQTSERDIQEFVQRNKINYPVAMITQEFYNSYRPGQYIPHTIIVDTKGKIRHRHTGVLSKGDIARVFQDLMEERTP